MHSPIEINELNTRLSKINLALRTMEEILACVSDTSDEWAERSEFGWLLSMLAEDPGTLLAVLFGRTGRSWDQCARELEKAIMQLSIEKRILEWELERQTMGG